MFWRGPGIMIQSKPIAMLLHKLYYADKTLYLCLICIVYYTLPHKAVYWIRLHVAQ